MTDVNEEKEPAYTKWLTWVGQRDVPEKESLRFLHEKGFTDLWKCTIIDGEGTSSEVLPSSRSRAVAGTSVKVEDLSE